MTERAGAERRSLLVTRSWLILTVVSMSWLLTAIVSGAHWSQLSQYEHLCIGLAFACFVIAVIGARRPGLLWLTVVGMLLLAATAIVPSGSLVWTYPQTYLGYVGFIMSLLLPRVPGLVTAILVPCVTWLLIQMAPPNVVLEGFTVADGSVQFLRMLTAQLVLWLAWHRLQAMAAQVDDEREVLTRVRLDALEEQERTSAWREAAARVHATMLNSINAVLDAPRIDSTQMRVLADQGRAALAKRAAPRPPLPTTVSPRLPVNAGVVLLSSALAGAMIGGSLYTFFIPYPSPLVAAATIIAALAGAILTLAAVIRWQRIDSRLACVLVLIPAGVPWLLSSWVHPCSDIGAVTATASLAGFAIVCIGLWSGPVPFTIGLLIWVAGALRISQASPAECAFVPTVIVLNVATFLPVVAIVILAGARRHRRSLEAMEELTLQAEAERRRVEAQAQVDEELSVSVTRAADVLDDIGRQGSMSHDQRQALRCLASRMRIAVMIDVVAAQGFSRSAYDLVVRLTDRGIAVDVGVASDSGDPRPIPEPLVDQLVELAVNSTSQAVRLQSMGRPGWDFLSLGLRPDPGRAPRLLDLPPKTIDDAVLTFAPLDDSADGAGLMVITVERMNPDHAPVVSRGDGEIVECGT